ncbi:MAG: hypothetical protein H7259_01515 [Cytophagales bacterium]|nr:hypothetical protein [Cytophaga sp.]
MKKILLLLTLLFVVSIHSQMLMAQPGNPDNGDDPDASVPIDGGLFTILGSGRAMVYTD